MDAYNALHVTGVLPPEIAGLDAPGLARLVALSRYGARPCWLVCDGAPPGSRRSGGVIRQPVAGVETVEIVYAGPGRDADSAIERLVERDSAPRQLLVVSSDRRILTAARKRRCGTLTSQAFLARLADDHAKPGPGNRTGTDPFPAFALDVPLDPAEAKRWREHLGVQHLDLPASPDPLKEPEPADTSDSPGSDAAESSTAGETPAPRDPLIEEALREWRGRIDPGELDMRRWLDGPDDKTDGRTDDGAHGGADGGAG